MKTKILVISVIEKDGQILMRKKPPGSKPYKETWYLFGAEIIEGKTPEESLIKYLKEIIGIEVSIIKNLGRSSETKQDHDGEIKQFIYLDTLCGYIAGVPQVPVGSEKVEWIQKENFSSMDIVPPARDLLARI